MVEMENLLQNLLKILIRNKVNETNVDSPFLSSMRRNRLNVMMKHHETLNLRINTKQHTKSILMSINKWNSLNYFYDKTEKKTHNEEQTVSVIFHSCDRTSTSESLN